MEKNVCAVYSANPEKDIIMDNKAARAALDQHMKDHPRKANAIVKDDQLACYNWTEGDRLVVGDKKYILVDDAEWLHECYNLDKEEYGDVCTSQVEFL